MNRILAPLAVVVCTTLILFCAGPACARQLSQADKEKALQLLESTKKDVLDATKGLSDARWNLSLLPIAGPSPNVWSTLPPRKTTFAG